MQSIRLLFSKTGMVKYISHLDLQRTMMRALVRSGLRVKYTEGFNPHIKVAFALPLSVGTQSMCEMMDFKLESDETLGGEEICGALNGVLPSGIRILEAYEPVTAFKEIVTAVYEIKLAVQGDCSLDAIRTHFDAPVILQKKTKSGIKDADIAPDVHSIEPVQDGRTLCVTAELSTSSANYLNPIYVVKALESLVSVMETESICRIEVMNKSGGRFR